MPENRNVNQKSEVLVSFTYKEITFLSINVEDYWLKN